MVSVAFRQPLFLFFDVYFVWCHNRLDRLIAAFTIANLEAVVSLLSVGNLISPRFSRLM
jgi:hypothetical protein